MYLAELTSPQLAALPRETPIVFPIAALEQHGGHLPVLTDTQLVGEVVRRAELALSSPRCSGSAIPIITSIFQERCRRRPVLTSMCWWGWPRMSCGTDSSG